MVAPKLTFSHRLELTLFVSSNVFSYVQIDGEGEENEIIEKRGIWDGRIGMVCTSNTVTMAIHNGIG